MELHFSELDTKGQSDKFDYNSYKNQSEINYWEKDKEPEKQTKKKKVTFNDILSNMNLVVNNQGVLQFMMPNREEVQNEVYVKPEYKNINIKVNNVTSETPPIVKHSYIYNKYFKDYVDPNVKPIEPRVPKTKEEYFQMLMEDRQKAIEHKILIDQIKPKTLQFTSHQSEIFGKQHIIASRNNLRSMRFG